MKELKKTDEDRLIEYYAGVVPELTEDLAKKDKRYRLILSMQLDHRSDRYIVMMLKDRFGIGKTQAYIDIHRAQYIYGSVKKLDRGFELYKQQQDIERAIHLAIETGNQLALLKALELRDKLITKIPEQTDLQDQGGNKNFYMLVQLADQQTIKIDMKTTYRMKEEEARKLIEDLNSQTIDSDYEELASELKKDLDE